MVARSDSKAHRVVRRTIAVVAAAVAIGATFAVTVATPAAAAPRTPSFGSAIDAYAAYQGQTTCNLTPKPGLIDVKNLVTATYGSRWVGISGDCSRKMTSEHKEGRALDLAFNAYSSGDKAKAQDFLRWLLATDKYGNKHAMARRLGVMYIIWNKQTWRAYRPGDGWQPYSGSTNPHTDHIHISFSWNGALRKTSWWTQRNAPPATPTPMPAGTAVTWSQSGSVESTAATKTFRYGAKTDVPLVGDWNGKGGDTPGVYRPAKHAFLLRNSSGTGAAHKIIKFGRTGDVPVAGDWDDDRIDEVGVYRPGTSTFLLRKTYNTVATVPLGRPGDRPVVGDWDGDGADEVGVYRPGTRVFYLRSADGTEVTRKSVTTSGLPVIGDWDGNLRDEVGIWRSSSRTLLLSDAGGSLHRYVLPKGGDGVFAGSWDWMRRSGTAPGRPGTAIVSGGS